MYIIDTYAVLELEHQIPPGPGRSQRYDKLSELVSSGDLVFPDAVLNECKKFATGETATVWLVAVSAARQHASFPGSMPMEVLGICAELLAPDQAGEQSQVDVACLARARSKDGVPVVVVTEDLVARHDRITLAEACDVLGISHCRVRKMLADLGQGSDGGLGK